MKRATRAGTWTLVALLLSSQAVAVCDAAADDAIAKLEAQADQLQKEIATVKLYAANLELREMATCGVAINIPFHTEARSIQLSQVSSAWAKRPDAGTANTGQVAPTISFNLTNIGTAPATNIVLIVSFHKPDGEVIGGDRVGVLDPGDAPLRTGMWKKVTIDTNVLQVPAIRSVIALTADIYLQTDLTSVALIKTLEITPRLEP